MTGFQVTPFIGPSTCWISCKLDLVCLRHLELLVKSDLPRDISWCRLQQTYLNCFPLTILGTTNCPILGIFALSIFCKSACEGLRDFSDTLECPDWPHLYLHYEAIYTLDCLFFEKIAEYWFSLRKWWKISISWFSRKITILWYMLLHNTDINVAIPHILVYPISL